MRFPLCHNMGWDINPLIPLNQAERDVCHFLPGQTSNIGDEELRKQQFCHQHRDFT